MTAGNTRDSRPTTSPLISEVVACEDVMILNTAAREFGRGYTPVSGTPRELPTLAPSKCRRLNKGL